MDFAANIGAALLYLTIITLCMTGVLLSCLSISGTWLVSLGALLTYFLKGDVFVGWICVVMFIILSAMIEVVEIVAGTLGVSRKGGSKLAGFMALAGGLLGAMLGTLLPIPIPGIGNLIGMFLLSFLLVYAVEYRRLKSHSQAADIATGSLLARVAIILTKVTATLGMIIYLWIAVIIKAFQ